MSIQIEEKKFVEIMTTLKELRNELTQLPDRLAKTIAELQILEK